MNSQIVGRLQKIPPNYLPLGYMQPLWIWLKNVEGVYGVLATVQVCVCFRVCGLARKTSNLAVSTQPWRITAKGEAHGVHPHTT
jgi:hypothetical protein